MPWMADVYDWYSANKASGNLDGLYNAIILDLLRDSETLLDEDGMVVDFVQIVPHYAHVYCDKETILHCHYILQIEDHAVLVLDVNAAEDIGDLQKRLAADRRMREIFRYYEQESLVKNPIFYGVGFMGKQFALYHCDRRIRTVSPPCTKKVQDEKIDILPALRWNHDALNTEGEQLLRAIVKQIKHMSEGKGENAIAIV